ncbi:MAG: (2Fe-2S)-binding protein [Fulvivirga sp.]|nr:(2Fe-2S)-binding protein [Fulvivirga sp.]
MKSSFSLIVNGESTQVEVTPDTPLLYVLRNELTLNGPKFGCGLGQCGACMVLLENQAVPSCQLPVSAAESKSIVTLEGLAAENEKLHKLQQAFVDEQAAQCGYCLNGMIINGASLLKKNNNPSEIEIRNQLSINICRCGVHHRIIKAIKKAASS